MPMSAQTFFESYAKAYESGVPEAVSELYFIPAVIMSDDTKNVFTDAKDVTHHIQELMDKLEQIGVVQVMPDVCQTMRLSENIMFSNVRWKFSDMAGNPVFSCFVSYTLQLIDDNLRVIVSVIDDEERELAKLL